MNHVELALPEEWLAESWNMQADEFNQWDSLSLGEQLGWAQVQAVEADRCRRPAALAEPVWEGPSEVDIEDLADVFNGDPVPAIRRALELWGRPATPPVPETTAEALAARPLLERVARLGDCIGAHTVGEITAISDRAAAWLRDNPPGQPVAIEPRGCPTPGACSCVELAPPAPEVGEVGELVDRLGWIAALLGDINWGDDSASVARAATLLQQQAAPPVPEPGEVGELVAELRHFVNEYQKMRGLDPDGIYSIQEGVEGREAHLRVSQLTRIATLLEQLSAPAPVAVPVAWGNFRDDGICVGLSQHPEDIARWQSPRPLFLAAPAVVPVAVSERLPGEGDCIANPRTGDGQWCWGWIQRDPPPCSGRWTMMRREWLVDEALAWLPAHAIPLPQAEEVKP
jgi:hypothetical protein